MKTNKPEVRRYDTGSAFESDMWETEDGNYVEWEAYEALQAEREKLRSAIRRLCNIYVVDDYYEGHLRDERLEAAVNRAINAVMETTP